MREPVLDDFDEQPTDPNQYTNRSVRNLAYALAVIFGLFMCNLFPGSIQSTLPQALWNLLTFIATLAALLFSIGGLVYGIEGVYKKEPALVKRIFSIAATALLCFILGLIALARLAMLLLEGLKG